MAVMAGMAGMAVGAPVQAQQAGIKAETARMYDAYGRILATGKKDSIAVFYDRRGAIRVFNGEYRQQSWASIDSTYRARFVAPAMFRWTSLTFDSIGPSQVIVTGGFQWQHAGKQEIEDFLYMALVESTDAGPVMRLEYETLKPRR
jgi:hypothetical protein